MAARRSDLQDGWSSLESFILTIISNFQTAGIVKTFHMLVSGSLPHVSESCAFWTLRALHQSQCVFYSFTDPTMRWRSSGLSLFLLLSIFVLKSATELRICAYNVQNFDSAKASNGRLMHYLKLVTHTLLSILFILSCCCYEWIIGRIGSGAVFMTRPMTFFLCAHVCVQVLTRCDISLLQHVVDPDGRAIEKLLSVLNR